MNKDARDFVQTFLLKLLTFVNYFESLHFFYLFETLVKKGCISFFGAELLLWLFLRMDQIRTKIMIKSEESWLLDFFFQ